MKNIRKISTVTIEDVAQAANVSVATVSRVLNNGSTVTDKSRNAVIAAIKDLGYVPNIAARNFRKRESRVILVVAPNFTNPFYAHILDGISDAARAHNYNAFISSHNENSHGEFLKNAFETRQIDGAILLASTMNDEWLGDLARKYPLVQCAEYVDALNIPSVSIDNYSAMREIINHLIQIGHRRIALISSTNCYISTKLREKAYNDAIRAANFEIEPMITFAAENYTFESGMTAAQQLMSLPRSPTAIACVSDVLALGAMAEIQRRGKSVPGDISVAGFDDVDYTKMAHPYLTTIEQPCYEMGKRSVELLLNYMQGNTNESRIFMNYTFQQRESTAKLICQ